jgi:hypothetical protein
MDLRAVNALVFLLLCVGTTAVRWTEALPSWAAWLTLGMSLVAFTLAAVNYLALCWGDR